MSQYHKTSNEAHETWQEMQEALHEAYEMQEQEAALNGEVNGARIVTPAVIIRITLAPAARGGRKSTVFGSPRAIVGATSDRVQSAPLTGSAYVPIRTRDTNTGQTAIKGAVFVPQRGGNVVQAATWAPPGGSAIKQAGRWLNRQIVQVPALRRRIRRVQVLVDGKPCQHCVKQLAATVKPVTPPNTNLGVRFVQTLPATTGKPVSVPMRTAYAATAPRQKVPVRRNPAVVAPANYVAVPRQYPAGARPMSPVTRPVARPMPPTLASAPRPRPVSPAAAPMPRPRPMPQVATAPRPQQMTRPMATAPAARPRDPQTGKFVATTAAQKPVARQSVLGQAMRELGI